MKTVLPLQHGWRKAKAYGGAQTITKKASRSSGQSSIMCIRLPRDQHTPWQQLGNLPLPQSPK